MTKEYKSLGLMSGTSMDGVDASIIQSDGETKYEVLKDKPNLAVCRQPLENFGFRCGRLDRQQNRFDAYPPQHLPSIEDIIGDQYSSTCSLNSVPKCIAYLEGVLNRLSGGRLFPSPSAPKKKRGRLPPACLSCVAPCAA